VIALDHTIVPAKDKVLSAQFLAKMLGLTVPEIESYFVPVRINLTLTFDFAESENFEPHHYAFLVAPDEFDAILERVKAAGVPIASGPFTGYDGQLYNHDGKMGFYFSDRNDHFYEVIKQIQEVSKN
jgi:catechol 2,3-dioxygenase-like lactoylglutathione lyase family enzyme